MFNFCQPWQENPDNPEMYFRLSGFQNIIQKFQLLWSNIRSILMHYYIYSQESGFFFSDYRFFFVTAERNENWNWILQVKIYICVNETPSFLTFLRLFNVANCVIRWGGGGEEVVRPYFTDWTGGECSNIDYTILNEYVHTLLPYLLIDVIISHACIIVKRQEKILTNKF